MQNCETAICQTFDEAIGRWLVELSERLEETERQFGLFRKQLNQKQSWNSNFPGLVAESLTEVGLPLAVPIALAGSRFTTPLDVELDVEPLPTFAEAEANSTAFALVKVTIKAE
jgi:hypothetical protein